MDTQTQIDRLIELAIIQRSELKQLVEQLPQLRDHLNAEVEKVFDETEPQLRAELEEWTTKQTADKTAALGVALEAKIADLAKSLEVSTQARYNAIIAEREENTRLAAQAEAKIAEHAASLPSAVKKIVSAELARFPRAGEIDQLRKEFAEPRGLNPRGKWQAGETYNKLDLVTINGDSYTSNTDGNRTRPSRSSADWTLVAARGTGGGGGPTSLSELTTVPSDGDVLIGSGTSWVTSNLTAGAGISITVGPGAITISATDGDITLDDGTAASPSLHFTNDPDTGIYRPAANTLGISVSGTQVAYFDENGLTVPSAGVVAGGSIHAGNGNANNPSLSFDGDQDTGFFRHQANEIGIALGGTQYATLTSTTFSITPVVTMASSLRVNGTTDSSNKDTGAIVTEGGLGVEKSATIGGNLTVSGGTGTIDATGGTASATLNLVGRSSGTAKTASVLANSAGSLVLGAEGAGSSLTIAANTGNTTVAYNLTVNGGTITGGTSGMSLASGGTNQNITLTPSGTGKVVAVAPQNYTVPAFDSGSFIWRTANQGPGDSRIELGFTTVTGTPNFQGYAVGPSSKTIALQPAGGNLLIGTTSDGGQKLQVAGTVAKTAAGPTTIAIASNEASNLRDEGRLFIVGNASAGSRYLGLEYYDVGNGAYRNVAAVPNGGNFLVGTATDGGQKLQVSGDIAVGSGNPFSNAATKFSFTSSTNYAALALAGGAGTGSQIDIGDGAIRRAVITGEIDSTGNKGKLIFRTNAGSSATSASDALTLDSSQRCILAGALRLNNAYVAGAPTATGYVTLQDSAGNTYKVLVGT